MLNKELLAKLLFDEFQKGNWGEIDPYLFSPIDKDSQDEEFEYSQKALYEVLDKVCRKINTI